MDNEKKGIYGNAEELEKKERNLGNGENPIYGEPEGAVKSSHKDTHTFMADPDGHNPIIDKQIRYSPETPNQTDGVYTQAGELAEQEKALKDTDDGIYSDAEDLAKNNAADMHNFMADSDGKK